MHLFTGNVKEGHWEYRDANGKVQVMTPGEVRADPSVVWIVVEGSGDFYWPHKNIKEKLTMMEYDDTPA